MTTGEILWSPPADVRARTGTGRYLAWLEESRGLAFEGYQDLWRWSVDELEDFWRSIWDYFEVESKTPFECVLSTRDMPGARWFPGATLNYAEHVMRGVRRSPVAVPVKARSQTRGPVDLTAAELADQVARARAGLARLGVRRGDRVAAYLPNGPEALIAFLAVASLGAVWASCAPEFGTRSVLDRLQQVAPKVLLAVDGYRFGDKTVDRRDDVQVIRSALPSLEATVMLPYLLEPAASAVEGAISWSELCAEHAPLEFEAVPFDHPLYVLYSSGTTGLPKPIVHGHGGILIEHLKLLSFHQGVEPGGRFLFFTTTGWMVWNLLPSVLALGSGVVLFDGNPGWPGLETLWQLAVDTRATVFGGSAGFYLACRKAGVVPRDLGDTSSIQTVLSTGAPLPPEGFRWIYEAVGNDVFLASTSGGTDVCSGFVGGSPLLPVRAGEIACHCLGCRVESFDEHGKPLLGEQGELVLTEPMPSMPVGFWNDPDGSRYRAAYFDAFPGVWRHGDWITISPEGTSEITGRSDATLNRGGVRLGTSEFYTVVEQDPAVTDSLVVHLEDGSGGPGELILFVVLAPGADDDARIRVRLATELRGNLSPRHVPDTIVAVPDIPRTLSGKKLEVPVKRILTGTPVDEVVNRGALANPSSLETFQRLAEARRSHASA